MEVAVAFRRDASGFADGADDRFLAEGAARFAAGGVHDVFLLDGTVDVIGTEAKGQLGNRQGEHDPVGFDVGEVVQHEP